MKREALSNELQMVDNRKIWKRPSERSDNGKQFLTNLLYMVNLKDTMKMIVPYYWNPGKTIIDVTAGKRLIWGHFPYNHESSCGFQHWHVDFNDINPEIDADFHIPAQQIHTIDHWDLLVCDFPFTDLKNGVESFGVKSRKEIALGFSVAKPQKFRREFYFDNFVPLAELFPQCVEAFNQAADSLIIKMGDSHKNGELLTNITDAELCFDHKRNPNSEFRLVDRIGYRGNYARRGGRFPFAQTVLSYYLIFKKDPKRR